ncbi:MAG: MFS transporter [Oscillospiraceae bacterium]|jgi:DHA3 family macrolide efflux protein-like MFS transporter
MGINQPSLTAPVHWKRDIILFLSGQTISLFGSSLVQFAIIWHITLTTSSGLMVTISTLCGFLPQLLISLFAGVWADRYSRRVLIMAADGVIAFFTLVLALLFLSGHQELWLLFTVLGIRSVGQGIQTPAVNAMIPQLVPTDKLMRINGINGSIQSLTMVLSPAISGTLLGTAGIVSTFFVDVGTAAIAIVIMFTLKVPKLVREAVQTEKGYLHELKTGMLYAWKHPFIKVLLIVYAFFMFFITPAAMLTPLMVTRSFGDEVWRLTLNEMIFSVGSIVGGVVVASWGGFQNRLRTIGAFCMLFGILTAVLGLPWNFWIYLFIMLLVGSCMPFISSPFMVLLQETTDPDKQGRVFSLVQIVTTAAVPLGTAVFGPVADVVSIEVLLIITGVIMAGIGLAVLMNKKLLPYGVRNGSASSADGSELEAH